MPLAVVPAQFGERHAFGGELLEQGQALRARLALQPVEQALGREVDAARRSSAAQRTAP